MNMFIKKEDGQSLVEFTMVLPIFLSILLAIIYFGNIYSQYMVMENATKNGGRMLMLGKPDNIVKEIIISSIENTNISISEDDITISGDQKIEGNLITLIVNYNIGGIEYLDIEGFPLKSQIKVRVE